MEQVGRAEQIAHVKYPSDQFDLLWLFDQSSSHTAMVFSGNSDEYWK